MMSEPIELLDKNNGICYECDNLREKEKVIYQMNINSKFGILLQNPGGSNSNDNNYKGIDFNTNGLIDNWLIRKNKQYFSNFFRILKENQLIDFNDFNNYCKSKQVIKDFYFFDAVKCRVNTNELKKENFDKCMNKYVKSEIESLTSLKILFVFSMRTWEIFYETYNLTLQYDIKLESNKITKVHGYLYKMNVCDRDLFVIPLVHMSFNGFGKTLRNSYFDYLKEGLRLYKNVH